VANPLKYIAVVVVLNWTGSKQGSETADKTCTRLEELFIRFGNAELGIDQ